MPPSISKYALLIFSNSSSVAFQYPLFSASNNLSTISMAANLLFSSNLFRISSSKTNRSAIEDHIQLGTAFVVAARPNMFSTRSAICCFFVYHAFFKFYLQRFEVFKRVFPDKVLFYWFIQTCHERECLIQQLDKVWEHVTEKNRRY